MPSQRCLKDADKQDDGPASPATTAALAPPTEPSGTPPPTPPYRDRERWLRIAHAARFPLCVYAAALWLHLMMLTLLSPPGGPGIRKRLLMWDAQWFLDVARNGYPHRFAITANGLEGGGLAFFPGYPFLVRVVHALTGLGYETAALFVSHLALLAALICVHRLLLRLYDRRTARFATALVACAQPMAMVFFMAYSESLFLALAAGALLALHRKSWLTAGLLTLLAGLTRPVSVAVIAALGLAVALHLLHERRIVWRPLAALLLACCGAPGYLVWVGLRTGKPDAWFQIQEAGWGTRWDSGGAFAHFLVQAFTRAEYWVPISTALLVLALAAATVAAWRGGIWPPFGVYGTIILITALGQSNYYHSKLRLLIPTLLFTIPLARVLSRMHAKKAVALLAVAALFGSWYGAYMITVWRYAI